MKKLLLKVSLFLFLSSAPSYAQADSAWKEYQPGIVEAAISNGKSVLLGYLSTW